MPRIATRSSTCTAAAKTSDVASASRPCMLSMRKARTRLSVASSNGSSGVPSGSALLVSAGGAYRYKTSTRQRAPMARTCLDSESSTEGLASLAAMGSSLAMHICLVMSWSMAARASAVASRSASNATSSSLGGRLRCMRFAGLSAATALRSGDEAGGGSAARFFFLSSAAAWAAAPAAAAPVARLALTIKRAHGCGWTSLEERARCETAALCCARAPKPRKKKFECFHVGRSRRALTEGFN